MVVAGAKGLAKELLDIFAQCDKLEGLWFFDNVSPDAPDLLFNRFTILRTFGQVEKVFRETGDFSFCLGLGNPLLRQKLAREFTRLGGVLTSVISPKAHVASFGTSLGSGCCVLPGAVITSSVSMGSGCLVNPNATISHDSTLGKFVEISPGANITGHCIVGDYSFIGANAVVLPKVHIGTNVIVGAGAVVTKSIGDNCIVAGVPAVVKRDIPSIEL